MSIALGNLTINQMQKRLGINLTNNDKEILENARQDNAQHIKSNKIHCFDIPFTIACGSMEMAINVRDILQPYSKSMTGQIGISIMKESEEEDADD